MWDSEAEEAGGGGGWGWRSIGTVSTSQDETSSETESADRYAALRGVSALKGRLKDGAAEGTMPHVSPPPESRKQTVGPPLTGQQYLLKGSSGAFPVSQCQTLLRALT